MVELQRQESTFDGNLMSSAQIVETVLGRRSGYIKGLGYGPKPTRSIRSNMDTTEVLELRETLRQSQGYTNSLESRINTQDNKIKELELQISTIMHHFSQQGQPSSRASPESTYHSTST